VKVRSIDLAIEDDLHLAVADGIGEKNRQEETLTRRSRAERK